MRQSRLVGLIFLTSLVMGILFDYFIYGHPLGLGFTLYLILGTVVTLLLSALGRVKLPIDAYGALAVIGIFSLLIFFRSNGFLQFLDILVILVAGAILIATTHGESLKNFGLLRYIGLIGTPLIVIRDAFGLTNRLGSQEQNSRQWPAYLRGFLLAVPLLIIFGLLFASADEIFRELLEKIFRFSWNEETIYRIIQVLVIGLIIAGSLGRMLVHRTTDDTKNQDRLNLRVGATEMMTVLTLLNLLFLLFIGVQIRYLFLGHDGLILNNLTYAEYARQGFGNLIFTSLLAFLVVWSTDKTFHDASRIARQRYLWAVGLLLGQIGLILVSAYKRLNLYEDAYGFTLDRFLAHSLILWLVVGFLLLIWKLWRQQTDGLFLRHLIVSVVAGLMLINGMNPDGFIARQQIDRYRLTGKLDTDYLTYGLSEDAIPVVVELLATPQDPVTQPLARRLFTTREVLHSPYYLDWQGAHFSRTHARKLLDMHQAILEENKNEQAESSTCESVMQLADGTIVDPPQITCQPRIQPVPSR